MQMNNGLTQEDRDMFISKGLVGIDWQTKAVIVFLLFTMAITIIIMLLQWMD